MAGNRIAFQEAVRKAHNLAWDQKWPDAIAEYRRALSEIDDDAAVWISLGAALTEVKRWPDARDTYQRAIVLKPDNLALPLKLAEVYEKLGNIESALQTYLNLATSLEKAGQIAEAADAWQAILRLQPLHVDSRQHLSDLLEKLERYPESSRENATLSRQLRERGRMTDAEERARKALMLDPQNVEARALVELFQSNGRSGIVIAPVALPTPVDTESPAYRARQRAFKRLADYLLENSAQARGIEKEGLTHLARAIECQSQNRPTDAIENFRRALAVGAGRVEARFILGMLYRDALDISSAIDAFTSCIDDREFSLGSHYALGTCYAARREVEPAVGHLLEAVRLIDSGLLAQAQSGGLINVYRALARRYGSNEAGDANAFTTALMEFFSSHQWPALVSPLRRRLDGLATNGEILPLAELLGTGYAELLIEALAASQEYVRRSKHTAAVDECYRAIALAPTYLPLHWQLAHIFETQGRTDAAVEKYTAMASLFRSRGEIGQVIECHRRTLKCEPTNQAVRARLIELLLAHRDFSEAIDHQIAAGQIYAETAQTDRALSSYQTALRLIPDAGHDRWTVTILHAMGDIYMQRAAWAESLAIYFQIRKLAPDDEKASLRLVDVYFKLGRDSDSERELAHLIKLYGHSGEADRLIPVVSDMASLRPRNAALRQTLINLLIDSGQHQQAVVELDALGDIQMNSGQTREAVQTIERIISLSPDNVADYRQLLLQLQKSVK